MRKPDLRIEIDAGRLGDESKALMVTVNAILNALRNSDLALGKSIAAHIRSHAEEIGKESIKARLMEFAAVAEYDGASTASEDEESP